MARYIRRMQHPILPHLPTYTSSFVHCIRAHHRLHLARLCSFLCPGTNLQTLLHPSGWGIILPRFAFWCLARCRRFRTISMIRTWLQHCSFSAAFNLVFEHVVVPQHDKCCTLELPLVDVSRPAFFLANFRYARSPDEHVHSRSLCQQTRVISFRVLDQFHQSHLQKDGRRPCSPKPGVRRWRPGRASFRVFPASPPKSMVAVNCWVWMAAILVAALSLWLGSPILQVRLRVVGVMRLMLSLLV